MKRYHFFAFLLCGVFMSGVLSLPYRNFSLDCESMQPDHSTEPQKSESPYYITVPSEIYDPGSEIKVNIEGPSNATFKWFMLQARDIDENIPVGSFQVTDPNTQGHDCYNMSNSALIHTNSDEKRNVTALWVSPEAKKIQFIATIFQDPETYWIFVPSIVLFPRDSNETAGGSVPIDTSKPVNGSSRSRKKSSNIVVRINCDQGGSGSYASSSNCQSSTFSNQGGRIRPQGGVVYQGVIKKGCGGGTAGVYNKYGCTDMGIDNSGSSYGQSVSTTKGKVVIMYPPSKPYPPERTSYTSKLANSKHIQNTQYTGKIQSQGSSPQSGVRITIQSGQPGQICDKTSPFYNSQACKLSIQSSTSQSGSSYGSQGGSPATTGGSGPSVTVVSSGSSITVSNSGAPSSVGKGGSSSSFGGSSGSSSSFGGSSGSSTSAGGSSGSSTSSSGSSCGQGYTYDGNPCNQGGSSQQNYGSNQGGSSSQQTYGGSSSPSSSYGTNQGGSSQQNYGSNQGGSSSQQTYGGSSQQTYGSNQGGSSSQQTYGSSQGGSSSQQTYGTSQQTYGTSQGGSSQQNYGSNQGGSSSQQTYGTNQGGSYTQGGRNPCDGSTYSGKILSNSNCPQGSQGGKIYGQGSQGGKIYGQGSQGGKVYNQGNQGGRIYGQGTQSSQYGSQTSGSYSSNNCDEGDVSTYGAKALSSANCRGKRDVAAQEASNDFIRKILKGKAASRALIRKTRNEKARALIRKSRSEKNESSNSQSFSTNSQSKFPPPA